jgi:hypothetical protein
LVHFRAIDGARPIGPIKAEANLRANSTSHLCLAAALGGNFTSHGTAALERRWRSRGNYDEDFAL